MRAQVQLLTYSNKSAHTLLLNKIILHFSYETLVAAEIYIKGKWLQVKREYISNTTSRHINQLFGAKEFMEVQGVEAMHDFLHKHRPDVF